MMVIPVTSQGKTEVLSEQTNRFDFSYIDEVSLVMRANDASEIFDDVALITWNSFDDPPYSDIGSLNLSIFQIIALFSNFEQHIVIF